MLQAHLWICLGLFYVDGSANCLGVCFLAKIILQKVTFLLQGVDGLYSNDWMPLLYGTLCSHILLHGWLSWIFHGTTCPSAVEKP